MCILCTLALPARMACHQERNQGGDSVVRERKELSAVRLSTVLLVFRYGMMKLEVRLSVLRSCLAPVRRDVVLNACSQQHFVLRECVTRSWRSRPLYEPLPTQLRINRGNGRTCGRERKCRRCRRGPSIHGSCLQILTSYRSTNLARRQSGYSPKSAQLSNTVLHYGSTTARIALPSGGLSRCRAMHGIGLMDHPSSKLDGTVNSVELNDIYLQ